MELGIIADDFTGAVDAAGFVKKNGMQTYLFNGVPALSDISDPRIDTVVMCLKIRSCPADRAVKQALQAVKQLERAGCTTYYYKYCSTFDSSEKGNIGQVTDAIMDYLHVDTTVVCPALPVNGRTVYKGYVFVGNQLIEDSPMRFHPITPMTKSYLPELMYGQFQSQNITHIYAEEIDKGPGLISNRINQARAQRTRYIIPDTLNDSHLRVLAESFSSMKFLTGGSGLVGEIAAAKGSPNKASSQESLAFERGSAVIISGSCSEATNEQVTYYKGLGGFCQNVSVEECVKNFDSYCVSTAQLIIAHQSDALTPMIYATKTVEERVLLDVRFPDISISKLIERFFAQLTKVLLENGTETFIVAGGESAGTVVTASCLESFRVGTEISPGVSWIVHTKQDGSRINFALKSGNFGTRDFFQIAQTGVTL